MRKRAKNGVPVHVTAWGKPYWVDGVAHVPFFSGPDEFLLVMGPRRIMEGREIGKRLLEQTCDTVTLLPATAKREAPGSH